MFFASLIALSAIAFGQAADSAREIPLCEIGAHPEQFNGKMVRVREPVLIDFEQFELSTRECDSRLVDSIWLEYGKGPSCGNLTPRDSMRLDREFHRLM